MKGRLGMRVAGLTLVLLCPTLFAIVACVSRAE